MAAPAADHQIEPLPSDAPNSSPDELCNDAAKREMPNAFSCSIAGLLPQAHHSFARLGWHPNVLLDFLHHPGLDAPWFT